MTEPKTLKDIVELNERENEYIISEDKLKAEAVKSADKDMKENEQRAKEFLSCLGNGKTIYQIESEEDAEESQNLSMVDYCFTCGKEQGTNEPYEYYELEKGHISFCSKKCRKIYIKFAKLNKKSISLAFTKKDKEMTDNLADEILKEFEKDFNFHNSHNIMTSQPEGVVAVREAQKWLERAIQITRQKCEEEFYLKKQHQQKNVE